MEIKKLYKAYPILKEVNERNFGRIEENIRFLKIRSGEYLKWEECPGLVLIINGGLKAERLDAEGRQTNMYDLKKGEICHENLSCYIECDTLNITRYALVDTELAILPRGVVTQYLLEDAVFMQYLYKSLYIKFKTLIENKEALLHESIEERVLKYLEKQGKSVIYTTHQKIALELGTAREVVSRKLKELEKEGYVALERGKIKILQLKEN
jgi:CRP/FNR family transcriptional regulator